jgi:hypothetical protein
VLQVPESLTFGAQIIKVEEAPGGGVYVYGKCTGDDLDLDDQIIDKDWAREALQKWFKDWANVRQMHSTNLPPAGKAVGLDEKEDGFYLKTHVVEPTAVDLVKNGVYQAYSIGVSKPRIQRDIKAKGGRVVGGIVSENSLVDFPANPTTKFMIAKRAKGGAIQEEQLENMVEPDLEKEADDSVEKGMSFGQNPYPPSPGQPPQPFQGQGQQPAAGAPQPQQAMDPNNPVSQADVDGDGDADAEDAYLAQQPPNQPPQQKPGVDPQAAAMTAATAAAAAAHAATSIHQQVANGELGGAPKPAAPPAAPAPKPPAPGGGTPASNAAPHAAPDNAVSQKAYKRLHDAVCAAYSMKQVKKAHPLIAKHGIHGVIDPAVVQKQLNAAVSEEHPDPTLIKNLSDIFLAAATIRGTSEDTLLEARSDLHKLFTDMYPDTAKPSPTSMSPGQFKRPYVGDGRSPAHATSMDNAMPTPENKVPSPGDFDRGPLTSGRQDDAPESTDASPRPKPGQTGRVYYTNAARDQANAAMQSLHDRISAVFPALCPMTDSSEGAVGSSDAGGLPQASAPFDNRANAVPKPATLPGDEGPIADQWSKNAVPDLTKAGMMTPDAVKAMLKQERKTVKAKLEKKFAATLEDLHKRITELESLPDPGAAPLRGSVQTMRAFLASQSSEDQHESAQDLQKRARQETVEYLERLMRSGNPEIRMRAEAQLSKLFGGVTPTPVE